MLTPPPMTRAGTAGAAPGSAARGGGASGTHVAHVEARILAKVVAVVSPAPVASTRLLARSRVAAARQEAAGGEGPVAGAGFMGVAVGSNVVDQTPAAVGVVHGAGAVRKSLAAGTKGLPGAAGGQHSSRRGGMFRS